MAHSSMRFWSLANLTMELSGNRMKSESDELSFNASIDLLAGWPREVWLRSSCSIRD